MNRNGAAERDTGAGARRSAPAALSALLAPPIAGRLNRVARVSIGIACIALASLGIVAAPREALAQAPAGTSAQAEPAKSPAESAKAAAEAVPRVQQLAFYPDALRKPIEDKVTVGGPEVLDRALKTNLEYGQNIRPVNAPPDHPLLPKVKEILRALPPAIHQLAAQYVTAVYLLEEDWGTGTTEGVQDAQGRWQYAYIALNLSALTRTANAWATWKENSAFRPQSGYRIAMTIQPPAGDTLENAVQFILVHELGHAIGLGLGVHGFWDEEGVPPATRDSTFIALSWQPDGKGWFASRYAERFPKLVQARFYRFDKAPLALGDAEAVYRALGQTDLPSLYGVTNLYDDFAETFAIYVHTRLLGKPYKVDVYENETLRTSYTSCIVASTCPEKVRALEALLAPKARSAPGGS